MFWLMRTCTKERRLPLYWVAEGDSEGPKEHPERASDALDAFDSAETALACAAWLEREEEERDEW